MKTCKICGATSDEKAFYAGVNNRCAECHRAKVKENRDANPEYYREYDAKRFQDDPNVRERHRAYQKTEAGKVAMQSARKKWMAISPDKRAAHIILGNAVRDKRIAKPSICSKCGAATKSRSLHAHHEDYAKPLDVIWLCFQCHVDHHKD